MTYKRTFTKRDIATATPSIYSNPARLIPSKIVGQVLVESGKTCAGQDMFILKTFDGKMLYRGLVIPCCILDMRLTTKLASQLSVQDIIDAEEQDDMNDAAELLVERACTHMGLSAELTLCRSLGMSALDSFISLVQ